MESVTDSVKLANSKSVVIILRQSYRLGGIEDNNCEMILFFSKHNCSGSFC